MIGFYTPFLFTTKLASQERAVALESAVYLLSIIGKTDSLICPRLHLVRFAGFSNTAVRFLSGWVTKIPHMSPLLVNNIGLMVSGVAMLFVPWCYNHVLLVVFCIVWGGFIGTTDCLRRQSVTDLCTLFSLPYFAQSGDRLPAGRP